MEKSVNRDGYINEFFTIVDSIEKSVKFNVFVNKLTKHRYFKKYKQIIEDKNGQRFKSKREKIIFIMSEMTRETSTCNAIIFLLEKSGLSDISKCVAKYNKSLEPMPLIATPEITVITASAPKTNVSMAYPLSKKRGNCVIINNVEELGLENETKRLKNVFDQLDFTVKVLPKLNAKEMVTQLETIRNTGISKDDEAFVLFVVSHGQDDKVFGYDACKYIKQISSGEIDAMDQTANDVINTDMIDNKTIIEVFSEAKCDQLMNKPKLHFFICCRVKSCAGNLAPETPIPSRVPETTYRQTSEDFKFILDTNERDHSFDTIFCYTCAEGYKTYFNELWGMTYFTQALTLSIAQYACDETITKIMSRTLQRLEEMFTKMKLYRKNWNFRSFAIEVHRLAMSREVYFNPGFNE